jgi:hypothetical protein
MDTYVSRTIDIDVADGADQFFTFRNMTKYSTIDIQINWDTLDALDGTIEFQESNDGVVYNKVATLDTNMDVATDSVLLQNSTLNTRAVRIVFDFGTAATGTVEVIATAKAGGE